jgi:hypothetical protein
LGGGFVVGVLGNKFTGKGLFEDALAKGFGTLQVFFDRGFKVVTNGYSGSISDEMNLGGSKPC